MAKKEECLESSSFINEQRNSKFNKSFAEAPVRIKEEILDSNSGNGSESHSDIYNLPKHGSSASDRNTSSMNVSETSQSVSRKSNFPMDSTNGHNHKVHYPAGPNFQDCSSLNSNCNTSNMKNSEAAILHFLKKEDDKTASMFDSAFNNSQNNFSLKREHNANSRKISEAPALNVLKEDITRASNYISDSTTGHNSNEQNSAISHFQDSFGLGYDKSNIKVPEIPISNIFEKENNPIHRSTLVPTTEQSCKPNDSNLKDDLNTNNITVPTSTSYNSALPDFSEHINLKTGCGNKNETAASKIVDIFQNKNDISVSELDSIIEQITGIKHVSVEKTNSYSFPTEIENCESIPGTTASSYTPRCNFLKKGRNFETISSNRTLTSDGTPNYNFPRGKRNFEPISIINPPALDNNASSNFLEKMVSYESITGINPIASDKIPLSSFIGKMGSFKSASGTKLSTDGTTYYNFLGEKENSDSISNYKQLISDTITNSNILGEKRYFEYASSTNPLNNKSLGSTSNSVDSLLFNNEHLQNGSDLFNSNIDFSDNMLETCQNKRLEENVPDINNTTCNYSYTGNASLSTPIPSPILEDTITTDLSETILVLEDALAKGFPSPSLTLEDASSDLTLLQDIINRDLSSTGFDFNSNENYITELIDMAKTTMQSINTNQSNFEYNCQHEFVNTSCFDNFSSEPNLDYLNPAGKKMDLSNVLPNQISFESTFQPESINVLQPDQFSPRSNFNSLNHTEKELQLPKVLHSLAHSSKDANLSDGNLSTNKLVLTDRNKGSLVRPENILSNLSENTQILYKKKGSSEQTLQNLSHFSVYSSEEKSKAKIFEEKVKNRYNAPTVQSSSNYSNLLLQNLDISSNEYDVNPKCPICDDITCYFTQNALRNRNNTKSDLNSTNTFNLKQNNIKDLFDTSICNKNSTSISPTIHTINFSNSSCSENIQNDLPNMKLNTNVRSSLTPKSTFPKKCFPSTLDYEKKIFKPSISTNNVNLTEMPTNLNSGNILLSRDTDPNKKLEFRINTDAIQRSKNLFADQLRFKAGSSLNDPNKQRHNILGRPTSEASTMKFYHNIQDGGGFCVVNVSESALKNKEPKITIKTDIFPTSLQFSTEDGSSSFNQLISLGSNSKNGTGLNSSSLKMSPKTNQLFDSNFTGIKSEEKGAIVCSIEFSKLFNKNNCKKAADSNFDILPGNSLVKSSLESKCLGSGYSSVPNTFEKISECGNAFSSSPKIIPQNNPKIIKRFGENLFGNEEVPRSDHENHRSKRSNIMVKDLLQNSNDLLLAPKRYAPNKSGILSEDLLKNDNVSQSGDKRLTSGGSKKLKRSASENDEVSLSIQKHQISNACNKRIGDRNIYLKTKRCLDDDDQGNSKYSADVANKKRAFPIYLEPLEQNAAETSKYTSVVKNPKQIICSFCSKEFKFRSQAIRHERSHTYEKPYTCVICTKKFSRIESVRKHLKTHKNVKNVNLLISTHIKNQTIEPKSKNSTKDADNRKKVNVEFDSRDLKFIREHRQICCYCDKTFKYALKLQKHILSHHENRQSSILQKSCKADAKIKTEKFSPVLLSQNDSEKVKKIKTQELNQIPASSQVKSEAKMQKSNPIVKAQKNSGTQGKVQKTSKMHHKCDDCNKIFKCNFGLESHTCHDQSVKKPVS